MSSEDVWGLFSALLKPASAEVAQLPAVQIPGRRGDYLAKTASGEAAFLLRGARRSAIKPPLRLRHIEIDYGSKCRIAETSAMPIEGEFIAIRCTDVSHVVLELFVRTVDTLIATLPAEPSPTDAESLIAGLVELFRKLGQPSGRTLKGLWAELFVIDRSNVSDRLMSAWHANSTEKYDFVTRNGYLEVKATEQPLRIHEFSIAQLRGPNSSNGFVVSMLLRRAAGGTGVMELARRIALRLNDTALRAKVWSNVFEVVGNEMSDASDLSFDERFAEHMIGVAHAQDVPCIELPLPIGVLDVRVVVDLTPVVQTRNLGLSAISQILT